MGVRYRQCQSCGLPLEKDPQGGGNEADGSLSVLYCSYCYRDGVFVHPDCTLEEMKKTVDKAMLQQGEGQIIRLLAKAQLAHLGRRKNQQRLRFIRRKRGRGWTPVTREGWTVLAIYVFFVFYWSMKFPVDESGMPIDASVRDVVWPITLATLLLLVISYLKGETPKRQRGEDVESDTKE